MTTNEQAERIRKLLGELLEAKRRVEELQRMLVRELKRLQHATAEGAGKTQARQESGPRTVRFGLSQHRN